MVLWGVKTVAWFDLWSIEHFLSGLSIGDIVKKRTDRRFRKIVGWEWHDCSLWAFELTGVLFLAYLWETIEHYLEAGLAGHGIEYWAHGVEFWANRIITDPLMMVIGFLVSKKHPRLVVPARILSLTWIIVHVFFFPHSMYLQELLFGK